MRYVGMADHDGLVMREKRQLFADRDQHLCRKFIHLHAILVRILYFTYPLGEKRALCCLGRRCVARYQFLALADVFAETGKIFTGMIGFYISLPFQKSDQRPFGRR